MEQLLTAPELAKVLRVNVKELYRKALVGEIPSYKFGRSRRFLLQEVLNACRDEAVRNGFKQGARRPLSRMK